MTKWKAQNRIERSFNHSLKMLSRQIETAIGNETDPQRIIRILYQVTGHPAFQSYCDALAETLTTQIYKDNAKVWRDAARQASRGSEIYRAIMAELNGTRSGEIFLQKIRDNAKLIRSFPGDIAAEITDYVQSESLKGRRASDIAKDLRILLPGKAEGAINRIARTEVSKTQTALTQARAQNLGLSWYVWRTSEDARVRSSHNHMSGVLIQWSDPPSPEALARKSSYGSYHAGDTFNCRCYPEPVVSLRALPNQLKVYYGGKIQTMTKRQFAVISGLDELAAA